MKILLAGQWLFCALLLLLLGIATLRLITIAIKEDKPDPIPLWSLWALGTAALTAILLVTHFFLPINSYLIPVGMAAFYAAVDRRFVAFVLKQQAAAIRQIHWIIILVFFVVLTQILFYSFNPMTTYDTWLYHDQALKWNEQYSIVPGLGNLHTRLAYPSTFFLTNALFDNNTTYVFSSFLYIFLLCLGSGGLNRVLRRQIDVLSVAQSLSLIALPVFIRDLPSLSNDIGGGIFYIAAMALISMAETQKSPARKIMALWVSLYAITVKLTFLPLGLYGLYLLYDDLKNKKYFTALFAYGLPVVSLYIPFLIRNVIVSGYLIYPFRYVDFFNVEWKIPLRTLVSDSQWIASWARVPGLSPQEVLGQGFMHWFLPWISVDYNMVFVMLFVFCSLVFFVSFLVLKTDRATDFPIACLISLISVLFWFMTAPDIRFGFSIMLVFGSFSIAPLLCRLIKSISEHKWSLPVVVSVFCLSISIGSLYCAGKKPKMQTVAELNQLVKEHQEEAFVIKIVEENITFYKPLYKNWCMTSPLPCTPYDTPPLQFKMRGESIKQGFNPS
ncbi:MAG: hypothetical protein AB1724_19985 [Thermodesulfobacteriota bacterium]